jgi:4-amino-4-deoxy-L-arabinose transferase-like glycosyltransferase
MTIGIVGLTIRIVYVLGWQNPSPMPVDSRYYHLAANNLANGLGFINPLYAQFARVGPGADHPPLLIMVLALPSLLGLQSTLAHQLWNCMLGAATVVTLGYVGRSVAGPRVGLLAALIAALYPGLWSNDAFLMPETLVQLLVAILLLLVYASFRRAGAPLRTRVAWAAAIGAMCGLAALDRGEMLLLLPVVALPVFLVAGGAWRERLLLAAVACVATATVIAPWTIYNLTRFDQPELINTELGITLLGSNCNRTYYGSEIGSWDYGCSYVPGAHPHDVSDADVQDRHRALKYVRGHASRVPTVTLVRLARTFGFFHPVAAHQGDEQRERPLAQVWLAPNYALAIAGASGAVVLYRRHTRVWPVLGLVLVSVIVTVTTYGNVRFRAPAEISLVVLGAVGIDAIARRWSERAASRKPSTRPSG